MIAPRIPGFEGTERPYEDVARELEDLGVDEMEGFELETAAVPAPEDEAADDEIGRASEQQESDEG